LLKNLKQSTEDSSRSQEMAWRTFTALSRMFPDQFPAEYQSAQGVSFEELHRWRPDQIRRLDAAILAN
jgi:hypothetical protein